VGSGETYREILDKLPKGTIEFAGLWEKEGKCRAVHAEPEACGTYRQLIRV
jgi:hypothetical protein